MAIRMLSSTVTPDRIWPVGGVFGDVVVSRRAALSIGWEVTWPPMFSCTEDEYDDVVNNLAMAIRLLPAWSVVHRQDVYTYEEYAGRAGGGHFLKDAYERHFAGRRYLVHRSYIFLSMVPRGLVDRSGKESGLFGISASVSVPSPADLAAFRSKASEFVKVFTTSRLVKVRPLQERDYLGEGDDVGIIQRYMMLGEPSPVMSDVKLDPDAVGVFDKSMLAYVVSESDSLPGVVATVDRVPFLSSTENELWLSFAARIGTLLDCEHVVNQIFVIPNQDEVLRNLEKEKNRMMSGMKSVDNRANGEQIAQFLEDQYKSSMFLVRTHMNVLAWAPREQRQDLAGLLSSTLRSMCGVAVYNNHNTPVLYYAGIPTNAYEIGRENLMTMELYSSLCLSPYETFEPGIPGGCLKLCDRVRHVPVELDTQAKAQAAGRIANYNMFILGGTGAGKSFFTNKMVRDLYCAGEAVFIIDVGDSYEGQAAVVREESGGRDGVYMSWDDEHPITFNAFAGAEEWLGADGTLRADEEGGNFFFTLVQTIYEPDETADNKGWTSERKTVLQKTILDYLVHCRDARRRPLFDDYLRWFNREVLPKMTYVSEWEKAKPDPRKKQSAEQIAALKDDDYLAHGYWCGDNLRVTEDIFNAKAFSLSLAAYAKGGAYGKLLNDPDPKDVFSSDLTVIEVDKLSQDDPKFYSVCILCIMHALDIKMRRDTGKFKTFIIEEAWKAISNETMAPYLRGLWKTARKFNTSACVVTQEIADIIDNPTIKTAIVDNSDVKILLDQKNHAKDFDPLQKALSLTDKDRNLVLSVNRGLDPDARYKEVFISLGGVSSAVYATEVSPEEALAFESNKGKKQPLLDLAARRGSMVAAIRELAARGAGTEDIVARFRMMPPTAQEELLRVLGEYHAEAVEEQKEETP